MLLFGLVPVVLQCRRFLLTTSVKVIPPILSCEGFALSLTPFSCSFPADNICFDHRSGVCNRGDNCKFSHSSTADFDVAATANDRPCFDFASGLCERGDACRFSHDPTVLLQAGDRRSRGGRGGGRPKVCFDFQANKCDRGDACR